MNISKAFNANRVFGLFSKKLITAISISAICLVSSLANSAYAANVDYSGTLRIIDTDGLAGINVGDTYGFGFSLDHSAKYTDYGIGFGFPEGTINNFSLWSGKSNTPGSWSPAVTSFGFQTFSISDNSRPLGARVLEDSFRLVAFYPSSSVLTGGKILDTVEFNFRDTTLKGVDRKVSVGQPFSEQFNGGFLNPQLFAEKEITLTFALYNGQHYEYDYVKAEFDDIRADTVTTVPEPGPLALLIPAALGLFGFTRRSKQA